MPLFVFQLQPPSLAVFKLLTSVQEVPSYISVPLYTSGVPPGLPPAANAALRVPLIQQTLYLV